MKKIRFVLFVAVAALVAFSSLVQAHDLFITVKESMAHPPGHANVLLGWGHSIPMDEFLDGARLQTYAIYDPKLVKMDFVFDPTANKGIDKRKAAGRKEYPSLTLQPGGYFAQNVFFKEDTPKGTYQVGAVMKPYFATVWKNKKGKTQFVRDKRLDEVKDAKEIIVSVYYQTFAKAFVTVGSWTNPDPLGHELEIVPITDLSRVKVGNDVSFKVLYKGKPLIGPMEQPYILKAYSEYYGNGYSFGLYGVLDQKGETTIRLTGNGQWIVTMDHFQLVTEKKGPKELVGKCLKSFTHSTLSFQVRN